MTHEPSTLNGKLAKQQKDAAKASRRADLVADNERRRQGVDIAPPSTPLPPNTRIHNGHLESTDPHRGVAR